MKSFTVDADFIKDAHEAACSEWKTKLEEKFPEVFEKEVFKFGKEFTLNFFCGGPLFIGNNMVSSELKQKCLVVNRLYDMEIKEDKGNKVLIFKLKK